MYEDEMVKMYEAGCNPSEIRDVLWDKYRYYRHVTTIRAAVRRRGVKMRTRSSSQKGRRKKHTSYEDYRKIEFLYWTMNLTTKEIGEIMGYQADAIVKRMKNWGIPSRTPSERLALAYKRGRKERVRGKKNSSDTSGTSDGAGGRGEDDREGATSGQG